MSPQLVCQALFSLRQPHDRPCRQSTGNRPCRGCDINRHRFAHPTQQSRDTRATGKGHPYRTRVWPAKHCLLTLTQPVVAGSWYQTVWNQQLTQRLVSNRLESTTYATFGIKPFGINNLRNVWYQTVWNQQLTQRLVQTVWNQQLTQRLVSNRLESTTYATFGTNRLESTTYATFGTNR